MIRLVSIGAALVAIASPCHAQTSARVCTDADPRVGQIVEIDDNKRMQINRRGQTIIASVGDPICQNDRTLPSPADIEISLDKAKERVTIPKGSIRDFTGVKPPPLTSGGRSADAGAAASLSPIQQQPMMRKAGFGDDDGQQGDGGIVPAGKPVIGVYLTDRLTGSGHADAFTLMIETALINTGKFEIVDRSRLAKLLNEEQLSRSGKTTAGDGSTANPYEQLDYLVSGTVASASSPKKSDFGAGLMRGILGGKGVVGGCANLKLRVEADIRLTDISEGMVSVADHILKEMEAAKTCNDRGEIDSAALMRDSAEAIAARLATSIFPITVIEVKDNDSVVLNYGTGMLKPGDWLMLYGEGSEIPDPSGTGTFTIDGEKIGAVLVTAVGSETSLAVPVSKFAVPVSVGVIGRPIDPPAGGSSQIRAKKKKKG